VTRLRDRLAPLHSEKHCGVVGGYASALVDWELKFCAQFITSRAAVPYPRHRRQTAGRFAPQILRVIRWQGVRKVIVEGQWNIGTKIKPRRRRREKSWRSSQGPAETPARRRAGSEG
jgi:hypothetical protein